MKEFCEVLKELRNEKGLSQEALGNIIHVSRSAIAKYENGLGMPSEEVIISLCNYFNVERDYLFPKDNVEEVIIKKNKTIKSFKYWFVGLISIILVLLISLLCIFVKDIYVNYKEKENLISEIQKENEMVPSLSMEYISFNIDRRIDGHLNENNIYFSDDKYIVYNELPFEIEFEVEPILFNCLDKYGAIKLNIFKDFIDVKLSSSSLFNDKYRVVYTGVFDYKGTGDLLINLFVEEFEFKYCLREYNNDEIKSNIYSKKILINKEIDSMKIEFKSNDFIKVTIKFYNYSIDNLYIVPGYSILDILSKNINGYGLYLEEKVNSYKEKLKYEYSILFDEKIEWKANDNISNYISRCDDYTLVARSKLLSNNINISMLDNTIQTCYPSGGYSVNNPICNKLTIYEGSSIDYILLNDKYYEITNDEVKINASNDNVIIKNKKIIGNKPGNVIVDYKIDLGFTNITISKEVEILPYAKVGLLWTKTYVKFIPYNDVTKDFYNENIKIELLNEFKKDIPSLFYEKTGYNAEVIDVYRFRNNEFYPILKTNFKYNSLEILVNNQKIENDIVLNIGDKLIVECFISEEEKLGECDIRHSSLSSISLFNEKGIIDKKGKEKRIMIITFGSVPYPIIIEYNIVSK